MDDILSKKNQRCNVFRVSLSLDEAREMERVEKRAENGAKERELN